MWVQHKNCGLSLEKTKGFKSSICETMCRKWLNWCSGTPHLWNFELLSLIKFTNTVSSFLLALLRQKRRRCLAVQRKKHTVGSVQLRLVTTSLKAWKILTLEESPQSHKGNFSTISERVAWPPARIGNLVQHCASYTVLYTGYRFPKDGWPGLWRPLISCLLELGAGNPSLLASKRWLCSGSPCPGVAQD